MVSIDPIQNCIDGEELLSFLLNTSFSGLSGKVEFDSFGDLLGQYNIVELRAGKWHPMMSWMVTEGLSISSSTSSPFVIPESVCSYPCKDDEYKIPKDVPCCWECAKCKPSEIPNSNKTGCVSCPEIYWSDDSGVTCIPINPSFIRLDYPVAQIMTFCTCLILVFSFIIGIMF